jgi:hypothetical protein
VGGAEEVANDADVLGGAIGLKRKGEEEEQPALVTSARKYSGQYGLKASPANNLWAKGACGVWSGPKK